jgi:uncharacterized protein YukE
MGWFDSVDGFLSGPPGDVDGMHAAAVDLDRMAGELRRLARGLDQRIGDVLGGVNAWRGPAARSFGERWQPVFRSLLTGAGALDDTVQTLRATAAPVAAAQDQHRQAMATLGASAAVTVADVLLGGAGAAASPGTPRSRRSRPAMERRWRRRSPAPPWSSSASPAWAAWSRPRCRRPPARRRCRGRADPASSTESPPVCPASAC